MSDLKKCSKCQATKPRTEFYKQADKKDGYRAECKACRDITKRKYAEVNKDTIAASKKSYYEANKKEIKQQSGEYKNRLKGDPIFKGKELAKKRRRDAAKLQRTPPWLTKEHNKQIQRYYLTAKWLEEQLGETFHVDHIHALRGTNFSGLHVPWNLQILPEADNLKKGNRLQRV